MMSIIVIRMIFEEDGIFVSVWEDIIFTAIIYVTFF